MRALLPFLLFAASYARGEPVFATDFESLPLNATLHERYWTDLGFLKATWSQGFQKGERVLVDKLVANSGTTSLRVAYPSGGVGPNQTGAQIPLLLPPREEYFISYFLRFDERFSFGGRYEGGKLPGLASGGLCSGGQNCDGTNGFSARLMWRNEGLAVLYLYHMDKPNKYGEDFPLLYPSGRQAVFTPGEWLQVTERVRINSGNENDGSVQIWINGVEALALEGIRFVNNGDLVDTFFFSTFHGGADADWAPRHDSYIWFDDLRVGFDYESVTSTSN